MTVLTRYLQLRQAPQSEHVDGCLVHVLLVVFVAFLIFDDFYLHCEHVEEERWSPIRPVIVISDHKTDEKKATVCW